MRRESRAKKYAAHGAARKCAALAAERTSWSGVHSSSLGLGSCHVAHRHVDLSLCLVLRTRCPYIDEIIFAPPSGAFFSLIRLARFVIPCRSRAPALSLEPWQCQQRHRGRERRDDAKRDKRERVGPWLPEATAGKRAVE